MSIKNLIFDVDGTLWDQCGIIADAWNDAYFIDTGKKLGLDDEKVRRECGKTMVDIANSIYPEDGEAYRLELLDHGMEVEHQYMEERPACFYPQVYETLRQLHDAGYKLFIVSNAQSGYIELVIRKGALEAFITDYLQFGDTNETKDMNIATIMRRNNLVPEETLYVGDIDKDNIAAHTAGIKMIYAAYGYGEITEPDYQVNHFAEIMDLVKKI